MEVGALTKHRVKVKKKYRLTKKEQKRLVQLHEKEDYTTRELAELKELEKRQYERLKRKNKKNKTSKHKSGKKSSKRNKNEQLAVKNRLFLECGTVDMYDMLIYEKRKLTLHRDPPFRNTNHTVFDESFLLTRRNHDYIEELQRINSKEYKKVMDQIRVNKQTLIERKKQNGEIDYLEPTIEQEDIISEVDELVKSDDQEEQEEFLRLLRQEKLERKKAKREKKRAKREAKRKSKKRDKGEQRQVKNRLLLECGTVDMYNMEIYDAKRLTIHREPPFRVSHHTVFEESYLLIRENHDYIEHLQDTNPEAYQETMNQIKANKDKLIRERKLTIESNDSKLE